MQLERKPEYPTSTWDEAQFPCPWQLRCPSKLQRRPDSPEATRAVPWDPHGNSRGTSRYSSQLKRNPEFPASTRDEVQFLCSDSIGIQTSPLQLKRRLDSLFPTGDVPWVSHHNSRGTPSFTLQLQKNTMSPTSSRDEGRLPCLDSRGIPTSTSLLKRRSVSPIAPSGSHSLCPYHQCRWSWSWWVLWRPRRPRRPPRTNTKKRCSIHHWRLEYKSRKSRDTWSNRQVWPWRTKWSRAKANWILPRECTGHRK